MEDKKKSVGIVLEGGAMRGMYTAGILDVLYEKGLRANKIVGVSAGALFGVNFVSGQVGRAIRYNKRFNSDKNYLGLKPLLKEGNIVSTQYAYHDVPHTLDPFDDEAFKSSSTEFYAVITNMDNGLAEYVRIKSVFDQMDTIRASGSMPVVSKPVKLEENEYLDGAIADSIPFEWMLSQGLDKTIVILTRDISFKKKAMHPLMVWAYKKKYPVFAKAMANRHIMYNNQVEKLKEQESMGKIFVFRPSEEISISRTERHPEKLQAVYDLGRKDAENLYESLIEYINKD